LDAGKWGEDGPAQAVEEVLAETTCHIAPDGTRWDGGENVH
jgi:hypothetical protein